MPAPNGGSLIPGADKMRLCPMFMEISYPPQEEVKAGRWGYRPFPAAFDRYDIGQAMIRAILKPESSWNCAAWLGLCPKKLKTKLIYVEGEANTGWGLHIVEGLDRARIVWLAMSILLGAFIIGLAYTSISGDPSEGFGISAFVTGVATCLLYFAR